MISKDENGNLLNFRIDGLDNILKAKKKAQDIIESCETNAQLDCAKRFVELYMKGSEDMVGTSQLELEILYKRKEVKDSCFTKRKWNSLMKKLIKND